MFVNIGFGNFINSAQIISISRFDSAPMKQQRSIQFQLTGVELIVGTFECEKLVVGTALDDPSVFQNHARIAVPDCGQPVGDDKYGTSLHQVIHTFLYDRFSTGINT